MEGCQDDISIVDKYQVWKDAGLVFTCELKTRRTSGQTAWGQVSMPNYDLIRSIVDWVKRREKCVVLARPGRYRTKDDPHLIVSNKRHFLLNSAQLRDLVKHQ